MTNRGLWWRAAQRLGETVASLAMPSSCVACSAPCDGRRDDVLCALCAEQILPATSHGAWLYAGPLQQAMRAAKYGPDAAIARALARRWRACIDDGSTILPAADGVAFVPAPLRRRVARGFDLPAVLARALATREMPLVDALTTTRHDPKLAATSTAAERAHLVAGRFRARGRFDGRTLVVIDDVRTTGATLDDACRALREAGATPVPRAMCVVP